MTGCSNWSKHEHADGAARRHRSDDDVYARLISLGAAKVNISTALKKTFADGFRIYLEKNPTQYDPLKLIGAVQNDVIAMAQPYFKLFGSEGQA